MDKIKQIAARHDQPACWHECGLGECPLPLPLLGVKQKTFAPSEQRGTFLWTAGACAVSLRLRGFDLDGCRWNIAHWHGAGEPRILEHDAENACPGLDPGWVPVFGKHHAPAIT
jgi:hypothetical protein